MTKEKFDVENKMTIFRKLQKLPYKAIYSHVNVIRLRDPKGFITIA